MQYHFQQDGDVIPGSFGDIIQIPIGQSTKPTAIFTCRGRENQSDFTSEESNPIEIELLCEFLNHLECQGSMYNFQINTSTFKILNNHFRWTQAL